jgi:hypothetical protein
MEKLNRIYTRTFTACVLSLAFGTAMADGTLSIMEQEYGSYDTHNKYGDRLPNGAPIVHVVSETGEKYNFIPHMNDPVRFKAQLSGSCGRSYKIHGLTFRVLSAQAQVSYPGDRGAYFDREGLVLVPKQDFEPFKLVQACNDELRSLASSENKSKQAIIAGGFGIRMRDKIEARGYVFCGGANRDTGASTMVDFWVNCMANENALPPETKKMTVKKATLVPFIKNINFHADKVNHIGKCPTGITFNGSITTSRSGTVKYRTVDQDGKASPTFTLNFSAPGTREISAWGQTFGKPDTTGDLSAGGSHSGPDYAGWRRLELIEPAGVAPSDRVKYSITCQDQPMQLKVAPVDPESTLNQKSGN